MAVRVWLVLAVLVVVGCSEEQSQQLMEATEQLAEGLSEMEASNGEDGGGFPAGGAAAAVPSTQVEVSFEKYDLREGERLLLRYTATLSERFETVYVDPFDSWSFLPEAQTGDFRGRFSPRGDQELSCSVDGGFWEGDWESRLTFADSDIGSVRSSLTAVHEGDRVLFLYDPPFVLIVDTPPACRSSEGPTTEAIYPGSSLEGADPQVPGYPAWVRTENYQEGLAVGVVASDAFGSEPVDLAVTYRLEEELGDTRVGMSLSLALRLEPAG